MSWVEDAVTFRGAIRRSGNSLVITIPAELSQRFFLREGQELVIYGLSRRGPEFEGSLQVYLGYFVVHEKAPTAVFKVKSSGDKLRHLQEVVRELEAKYLPSAVKIGKLGEDLVGVELVFGAITPTAIRRVRDMEEVSSAAAEMEFMLASSGFEVVEKAIVEKIIEWRSIDPAMLSKTPYKISEVVRWRWEI
ncbi:MAG: AbrB/MazE/SpoVT family DNA-binding domain-containing protein [Nitrososphaeria archaeon]|nr:AbrB/MazE/SpoVT family DNA-binding domain-containing protein [Nitrososphaeria archaeon]